MIGIVVVLALSTLAAAGDAAADKKQDAAKKPAPERQVKIKQTPFGAAQVVAELDAVERQLLRRKRAHHEELEAGQGSSAAPLTPHPAQEATASRGRNKEPAHRKGP